MAKLLLSTVGAIASLCCLAVPRSVAEIGVDDRAISQSLAFEVLSSIGRGGQYLIENQRDNGSWADHPAITSLAATALMNSPRHRTARGQYALTRSLDYLVRQARDDGSIRNDPAQWDPLHSTAVSILALVRAEREQDRPTLRAARNYLLRSQVTDPQAGPHYGGFAADGATAPTLTMTQWVLDALYLTDYLDHGLTGDDDDARREATLAAYRRAQHFIERCQQLRGRRGDDGRRVQGGYFTDRPDSADDPMGTHPEAADATPRSRAFLTAAGLKSLLYAGTDINNTRVILATDWIREHYTVSENPGMDQAGYHVYLFTLAQAMRALEWDILRTPDRQHRFWRRDVSRELLSRQHGDGSWRHTAPEWREDRPELATAYAMLILEIACAPEIAALQESAAAADGL